MYIGRTELVVQSKDIIIVIMIIFKQGGIFSFFCMFFIQHCFICRPSDSTVPEDAGIEPRTVATFALAVKRSNHAAISLMSMIIKYIVSPAYGFSALALVKCSNEEGPGPRHNMKEGSRDLYSDHEGRAWARGTL